MLPVLVWTLSGLGVYLVWGCLHAVSQTQVPWQLTPTQVVLQMETFHFIVQIQAQFLPLRTSSALPTLTPTPTPNPGARAPWLFWHLGFITLLTIVVVLYVFILITKPYLLYFPINAPYTLVELNWKQRRWGKHHKGCEKIHETGKTTWKNQALIMAWIYFISFLIVLRKVVPF